MRPVAVTRPGTAEPSACALDPTGAARELEESAPELVDGFRAALPRARTTVAVRLAEALWREDIGDARRRFGGPDASAAFPGELHAFDRMVLDPAPFAAGRIDPSTLVTHSGLRDELDSAVVGLALGYARRAGIDGRLRQAAADRGAADVRQTIAGEPADEFTVRLEQLATEGHNLHPCGRTRLGWSVADLLAHDLESDTTSIGWVCVPAELAIGAGLGELFGVASPAGTSAVPLHEWQLGLVRRRYPELLRDGTIRLLDALRPARPTAALRTLLLPSLPGAGTDPGYGSGYLKLSLDIQVTSTRRSISIASTRNGPALSELLTMLVARDPDAGRLLLFDELAGVASPLGTGRDLSALVRRGLAGRLHDGEQPVPGSALTARDPITGATVLSGLVGEYAVTRGSAGPVAAAAGFLREYAELLLPPVLRLAAHSGIGLEAHLQNCVPTFRAGVPYRMGLRDFAGMRLHHGRLARRLAGMGRTAPPLWPGSVIGTDDDGVLLAKVAYTAFQAHLGELVLQLSRTHGLAERVAWPIVRAVVDDVLGGHPDHAFLTARTVPHKALTRMRLAGHGDLHVPVTNPLATGG
jgi:D-ornithine---citrate ligase